MTERRSNGYPWYRKRLAPDTLREILLVSLPPEFVSAVPDSPFLLADLDARAWGWFSRGQCEQLADRIVATVRESIGELVQPGPLALRRLPRLSHPVALPDLDLSVRGHNALERSVYGGTPELLDSAALEDVLGIRSFGAKGLVELLVALEEAGATPQSDAEAPHPLPDDEADEETETLDPDAFVGGLTEHDVEILGAWSRGELDSLPRLLLRRRLPLIPEQTYVADLRLLPRTAGAITRRGHDHVGEWLRVATIRDILLLPNFGRSSMRDLLDGIVRLMLQPPPSDDVTAIAIEISAHELASEFTGDDPRFRSVAAGFCRPTETLRDAGVRLADRVRDPADHVGLVADLRVVITELERIDSQRLEDELLEICTSVSNERNGAITARYRGWDGRGGAVLQEVGDEAGMTRERVRQICVKVEKRLRAMNPVAPVLKRVLREIAERAPMWSDDLPALLQEAGLVAGRFRAQALMDAADLLGLATSLRVETVAGRERVIRSDDDSGAALDQLTRVIRRIGRRTVEHWGVGRIQDVARLAEKEHGHDVDESFVRDLLAAAEGFRWLDAVRGWYWNADVPRNRLTNQMDKVLCVAKSLPVTELRVAVARNYRMEGQAPPLDILTEFCRQLPTRVVEGDVVRADPALDPAKILADTELLFYETLAANGSVMSRVDLEDVCRERGMNRVTFYIYLGNSPILVCPRRGVYALVGSDCTDDQLASLVDRRSRRGRVLVAAGRHSQTRMWTMYCLSENMISSGGSTSQRS